MRTINITRTIRIFNTLEIDVEVQNIRKLNFAHYVLERSLEINSENGFINFLEIQLHVWIE